MATATEAWRSIGIAVIVTPVGPYSYTAAGQIERKVLQVVLSVPKRKNGPRLPRVMLSVLFRSITTFLALVSMTQSAQADCGYPGVTTIGSRVERETAFEALGTILRWFRDLGYEIDPIVTICFKDKVICEFDSHDGSPAACPAQVSGLYDFSRKLVEITAADSSLREDRRPWGVNWGEEIAFSILQHELAHMAVAEILESNFTNLSHPWHEFLAYSIQFDMMDGALRAEILSRFEDVQPFGSPNHVNPLIHAINPDAFAVRAYLYMLENGGEDMIVEILQSAPDRRDSDTDYLWTR